MDPQAYLIQQGWSGPGNPLNPSRRPGSHGGLGLTKPILVSRKRNTHGIGKKTTHDHTNQWWLRGFETALRGIGDDGSATPVSDDSTAVGGGGVSELYKFFVRGPGLAGTIENGTAEVVASRSVVVGGSEGKKEKKRKRDNKVEDGGSGSREREEKREKRRKREAEKELRLSDEGTGVESMKKRKKKDKKEVSDETEVQDDSSDPKADAGSDRKKKRRKDDDGDSDKAERKREKKLKKAAKKAERDSTSKSERKSKKDRKSKKKERDDEVS